MREMAAVTVSTNLDEAEAKRVRQLADIERRTVSNFVANAVVVFSELPRDLRDGLLELRVASDQAAFRSVVREMAAMVARRKFEAASKRLAERNLLPAVPEDATEADILDLASNLSRAM